MYLFHNSRLAACRTPFGAAAVSGTVTLSVDCRIPPDATVYLRLWQGRETLLPLSPDGETRRSITVTLPSEPGLLWYYFVVKTSGETWYYGKTAETRGGVGTLTQSPPSSWQITVYRPMALPEWYQNAVVYQIFPDRFHRGPDWRERQSDAAHPCGWKGTRRLVVQDWNDTPFYCKDASGRVTRWPFFGGTLEGIREKLPYLRALGVTVLYLNPIFTASSNHKYDTADYKTIDPAFGDEAAFSALCAAAEKIGVHILLDGVFSHTGDDSIYFNRYGNYPQPGAFARSGGPYDSWYRFGSQYPSGYECWWGVDSLPDVEENAPGFSEFICGKDGVIRRWLRLGASGWRLDVADELPDSFIRGIRKAEKAEKPDALLLGEVWEDASNKLSYDVLRGYLLGDELDCTMHYPFRKNALSFLLGTATSLDFSEAMDAIRENYPPSALFGALNLIGTHDTPRALTVLGEAPDGLSPLEQEGWRLPQPQLDLAKKRLRLLQILQFTSPGVPCVYYGDEAGAEGYADPYNRAPYPWGREDTEIREFVRILAQMREEYPVLIRGDVQYLSPNPDIFGLRRTLLDAEITVYVNRSSEIQWVFWPKETGCRLELLSGKVCPQGQPGIPLEPYGAAILFREGDSQAVFSPLPSRARTPRGRGLLCPLFSLPGAGRTGTMADAPGFLSAMRAQGYTNWMLLPLCPPGPGDSPYSSPCVFAGDTRLISPELPVDFSGFDDFCRENEFWLPDYALYTVLRQKFGRPWQQWPEAERTRKNLPQLRNAYAAEIRALTEEQYRFFSQWEMVHRAANAAGIHLIGDLPIYASTDGAEVWAHPELFELDAAGYPAERAGCPPDYFTPDGQDWGNPLYRWDVMRRDGFAWWKRRLGQALSFFDFVRLDHFRGFAAYYAIPAGQTARSGFWRKGPGVAFFRAMADEFGALPLIAEDLGQLDVQVSALLAHTGLSGMNVWQFSAREMAEMPPEEAAHRVFFSGTHDNQTLAGYLRRSGSRENPSEILKNLLKSPAAAVILPVQDVLGLGDESRINVPGVASGNWTWRMTARQLEQLGQGGIL